MRKLTTLTTPAAVAAIAALLPSATVYARDYRRTAYLEETAYVSPAAQNFDADEFFTQADRDLEKRIRANLSVSLDRPVADAAATLQIGVKEGAVVLAGTAPDEWTKEEIERRARRTLGVASVDDRIQVSHVSARAETGTRALPSATTSTAQSTGAAEFRDRYAQVQSRSLTDAERARLAAPAPPPPSDRELLHRDRTGSFPATQAQARAAVGDRQETGSGNMHDEDRTGTTGPSGSRSFSTTTGGIDSGERFAKPAGDYAVTTVDRSIAERVRTMLDGDPSLFVTPENVHIKVDNGYVILNGWANSQQEKDVLTERVREISGVQGVDNHLQVISRAGSRSGAR